MLYDNDFPVANYMYSQLQMFSMLMQQSPEVLMALGISPQVIRNEISKQENLRKLKVSTLVAMHL